MPPAAASWTVGSSTDRASTAFSVLWVGRAQQFGLPLLPNWEVGSEVTTDLSHKAKCHYRAHAGSR